MWLGELGENVKKVENQTTSNKIKMQELQKIQLNTMTPGAKLNVIFKVQDFRENC